jgi:hypothetical protein
MFRPTCGDYACVLSLFARKAAGADEAPGIPCALPDRAASLRQDPGAISSVAGMRRRVIESANAIIREQGKLSCPDLIGSSSRMTPLGVIARVSEATQSFLDFPRRCPKPPFWAITNWTQRGIPVFRQPRKAYMLPIRAVTGGGLAPSAMRRPNEASACDASAC